MKRLIISISIILSMYSGTGQTEEGIKYGLSPQENIEWLIETHSSSISDQLHRIQDRFFDPKSSLTKSTSDDVPILIIDGVPYSESIGDNIRQVLISDLNSRNVEIKILVDEPDNWYADKKWTGLILMKIVDKNVQNKIRRLN